MLKKIAVSKEPKLRVHKYVVEISKRICQKGQKPHTHISFHYCMNLKEVRQKLKDYAPKGSWACVYLASHNFVQMYGVE